MDSMEFTLLFEGRLKSAGTAKDKHRLRKYFHDQMKILWNQKPLASKHHFLKPSPKQGDITLLENIEDHYFLPLVSSRLNLIAELDILFLRPEEPGKLISGGDIDNKLKTLFDGLRSPNNIHEIPNKEEGNSAHDPMFCLLEDDKLITRVNVTVDRLLKHKEQDFTSLIIRVKIKTSEATLENIGLFS